MSQFEGKVLSCDRCGKHVILAKKGDNHLDGGYTVVPVYEDKPQLWGFVGYKNIRDLCPECYALWESITQRFISEGKGVIYRESSTDKHTTPVV